MEARVSVSIFCGFQKNELRLPNTEFREALKTTAKRIIEFIIFAAAFSHLSSYKNLIFLYSYNSYRAENMVSCVRIRNKKKKQKFSPFF